MIDLPKTNEKEIKSILEKNNIKIVDNKDTSGGIQIKHESDDTFDIYIKVDTDNDSIRIYGISPVFLLKKKNDIGNDEIMGAINMMNIGGNVLKYSSISNIALTFEYGIPLHGEISETHLIQLVNFIMEEASFIDGIFDQFLEVTRKIKKAD